MVGRGEFTCNGNGGFGDISYRRSILRYMGLGMDELCGGEHGWVGARWLLKSKSKSK